MRKHMLFLCLWLCSMAMAQQPGKYVEASSLNLIGKVLPTPNPYHRVDTTKYKGFIWAENQQVRMPAGIAVLFRTNSSYIKVKPKWGFTIVLRSTPLYATRGFDLYIRDHGEWVWAGAATGNTPEEEVAVLQHGGNQMKECMLYLPIYSELLSCQIGVEADAAIEAMPSPFRHRIAIHGSSYTHGISTCRAGMSYPSQFTRHTGLQMLNLGCSGNCKMQPYFANVMENVEADAYVFDCFSNPSADMIAERFFPFLDRMVAAHPGKPIIFQQTIYRENRNFNGENEATEQAKMDMALQMYREAKKNAKYKDVYFIFPNASVKSKESSADGTHPDDYGYYLWSKSIEKPLLKILRKYGIK